MKLLIIRHGENETDILDVHEGMSDFELTERGHRQAESVSEYGSQHYSIAKIYHSLLNGRLRRPVTWLTNPCSSDSRCSFDGV